MEYISAYTTGSPGHPSLPIDSYVPLWVMNPDGSHSNFAQGPFKALTVHVWAESEPTDGTSSTTCRPNDSTCPLVDRTSNSFFNACPSTSGLPSGVGTHGSPTSSEIDTFECDGHQGLVNANTYDKAWSTSAQRFNDYWQLYPAGDQDIDYATSTTSIESQLEIWGIGLNSTTTYGSDITMTLNEIGTGNENDYYWTNPHGYLNTNGDQNSFKWYYMR